MKLQLQFKQIPKLLVVLQLTFYTFVPLQVLATPYGGCIYGGDSRTENCLKSGSSSSVNQLPNQSFFDKYGWILFASLIFISLVLFILLLASHRKKSSDKNDRLPPPSSKAQR